MEVNFAVEFSKILGKWLNRMMELQMSNPIMELMISKMPHCNAECKQSKMILTLTLFQIIQIFSKIDAQRQSFLRSKVEMKEWNKTHSMN